MPATCFSSTGPLSFAPVAPRDQAVGPLAVVVSPSPPDEIIAPSPGSKPRLSPGSRYALAIAALAAIAVLFLAAPN